MKLLPTRNNFERFFITHGVISCLHSECILNGSLGEGMLALYKKQQFYTFVDKRQLRAFSKNGQRLYSNQKQFDNFILSFKRYIQQANKVFIPANKKTSSRLTKKQFVERYNFLKRLWHYYGFLEPPYQEFDLPKAKHRARIQKNLLRAAKLKLKAREVMNAYYFKDGVFDTLLSYFDRFNVDGRFLFSFELVDLLEERNSNKTIWQKRKQAYAVRYLNGGCAIYTPQQALKLFKEFTKTVKQNELRGQSAFPGRVQGKAIVAPMYSDQRKIAALDKQMQKGDILIAESTSPDWLPLCKKAGAIVADQGGMLSHAAIVSREMKTPCIVGTKDATRVFKTGDMVAVNANQGIVKKLMKPTTNANTE